MRTALMVVSCFGLVGCGIGSGPPSGQTITDPLGLRVEAALRAARLMEGRSTVFLDPLPEKWEGSERTMALERLRAAGLKDYPGKGIPPGDVVFLSVGTIWAGEKGTEVTAWATAFGDSTRFQNAYFWAVTFWVVCEGGRCRPGETKVGTVGDGYVSPACWDDYFERTAEERRECHRMGAE